MWSQTWDNVLDLVTPFPNSISVDVTPQLVEQVSPINVMTLTELIIDQDKDYKLLFTMFVYIFFIIDNGNTVVEIIPK